MINRGVGRQDVVYAGADVGHWGGGSGRTDFVSGTLDDAFVKSEALTTNRVRGSVGLPQLPVAAPTNIRVASFDDAHTTADVTWADHADNELGFHVQKSTDGGTTWTTAATTGPNQTHAVVEGLDPNQTVQLRVVAYDTLITTAPTTAAAIHPGPLDAAVPDGYVLVDTLNIDATQTNARENDPDPAKWQVSHFDLAAGVQYFAKITGTAPIAVHEGRVGDAEFQQIPNDPRWLDQFGPDWQNTDTGVRLGHTAWAGKWNVKNAVTYGRNTTGAYTQPITGDGSKLSAFYNDVPGWYGDNAPGGMKVEVYAQLKADLELYVPKVIDPLEPMIPDVDEANKGTATFVNLDNDDNDETFDDTDTIVSGGDDELFKLRVKVKDIIDTMSVKLTATAGAGDVKVWKQNDKLASSAYTLGTSIPKSDFTFADSWYYGDFWVEGVVPQATQKATTFKLEETYQTKSATDEGAATIIGVSKVEWGGYDNAVDDGDTLDADPNWPEGLAPGSHRVFPDKRVFASAGSYAQDAQARSIVHTKTTLSVAPPLAVKVYIDAFDVDDPTADADAVDDDGPASTETADNRGAVGTFGWQSSGVTPKTTVAPEVLSFSAGETEKQVDYIVSMQPGDNFRLVANADKDFLLRLNNNDQELNVGGAAANANKLRVVNQDVPVARNPVDREVRRADEYCSDVLTVWRFMHVESDSMAALPTGSNELSGVVTGIVGTGTALTEVLSEETVFADGSIDLDDGMPQNGRFEQGTLVLGSDATSKTIAPIKGNGGHRLVFPGTSIAGLSFDAADTDFFSPADHNTGVITNLITDGGSFVWSLNTTSEDESDWNEFVGGKLSVAGGAQVAITGVNRAAGTISTSKMSISFTVKDDDSVLVAPAPDLTDLPSQFARAFIEIKRDGGGNPSFEKSNVTPLVNVPNSRTAIALANAFESKDWRDADYWIAYVLSAYQAKATSDNDPNVPGEDATFGLTGIAPGGNNGSVIFMETTEDYAKSAGFSIAGATHHLRSVFVHEIGHQFFIPDNDPLVGATGNNIYWYPEVNDPSISTVFQPAHLSQIRKTASPGLTP